MRIEKCGFEKVAFIDVELAMIEICLPFDKILSYQEMEIELQNNFPTRILGKDKLVPIPLFSFNTAEGRVHRIVVFFISKENSLEKKADRVLPLIAALTKTAENVMQKKDGGENLLFWKFHKGVFFALLFPLMLLYRFRFLPMIPCPYSVCELSILLPYYTQNQLGSATQYTFSKFHLLQTRWEIYHQQKF